MVREICLLDSSDPNSIIIPIYNEYIDKHQDIIQKLINTDDRNTGNTILINRRTSQVISRIKYAFTAKNLQLYAERHRAPLYLVFEHECAAAIVDQINKSKKIYFNMTVAQDDPDLFLIYITFNGRMHGFMTGIPELAPAMFDNEWYLNGRVLTEFVILEYNVFTAILFGWQRDNLRYTLNISQQRNDIILNNC